MQQGTVLAALDLGSNSFRLELGVFDQGHIRRSDYLKETVRLGAGLDSNRMLSLEAMQTGWQCLERFAERLQGFQPEHVRAIATQSLREAQNRQEFLSRAEAILGFPVALVSGKEEARLIYQGVVRLLPDSDERRLVLDIGGRSTELILGHRLEPEQLESFDLGSGSWTQQHFADGVLSKNTLHRATVAAKAKLDAASHRFARHNWDCAYGASGTIGAVASILAQSQSAQPYPHTQVITLDGLNWLEDKLCKTKRIESLGLPGLKNDRASVFVGGFCILKALFELFNIQHMAAAQGALRHGALYDLLLRQSPDEDLRGQSVQRLCQRFNCDTLHAQRVSDASDALLTAMTSVDTQQERIHHAGLTLPQNKAQAPSSKALGWAASMHEIGAHISHQQSHKHGAYILEHSELLGFSADELSWLAKMVLGQKGGLKKVEQNAFDTDFLRQLLALRLAVILCHARCAPQALGLSVQFSTVPSRCITLSCDAAWFAQFPQTAYLLRVEAAHWENFGFKAKVLVI